MKKFCYLSFFLLLAACNNSDSHKPVVQSSNNTMPDSTIAAAEATPVNDLKDTTQYIGDFRVTTGYGTVLKLVDNAHPQQLPGRYDTLYADSAVTLLSSGGEVYGPVYRKYHTGYTYEMFPVKNVYKGAMAAPDFTTDKAARMFRTRIREACNSQGINFAGRFTIAEWGCGMECGMMALVDRQTGKIHFTHLYFDIEEGYYGAAYRADSRMLILNAYSLDSGYAAISSYQAVQLYEWADTGFRRIE